LRNPGPDLAGGILSPKSYGERQKIFRAGTNLQEFSIKTKPSWTPRKMGPALGIGHFEFFAHKGHRNANVSQKSPRINLRLVPAQQRKTKIPNGTARSSFSLSLLKKKQQSGDISQKNPAFRGPKKLFRSRKK